MDMRPMIKMLLKKPFRFLTVQRDVFDIECMFVKRGNILLPLRKDIIYVEQKIHRSM
jgi:hypothetical protein